MTAPVTEPSLGGQGLAPRPVHLCLSGGGFRAAFFHLGALHGLAEQGLLQRTRLLVTVSGGSIAAGVFFSKWEASSRRMQGAGASLTDLAWQAHCHLLKVTRNNPRMRAMGSVRALSRALVFAETGVREAMARQFERWMGDSGSAPLTPMPAIALPEWRIACSDYVSGARTMVVFNGRHGYRNPTVHYIDGETLGRAQAISASAAVPGIFEPLRHGQYLLSDGGVLDNLGTRELTDLGAERICIDAAAPLQPMTKHSRASAIRQAMDMLMEQARVDWQQPDIKTYCIRDLPHDPHPSDWRKALVNLRTDLDDFSTLEADLLYLAGYQSVAGADKIPDLPMDVANRRRVTAVWKFASQPVCSDHPEAAKHREKLLRHLERGRYRMLARLKVWTPGSFTQWLLSMYMGLSIQLAALIYVLIGALFLAVLPQRLFSTGWMPGVALVWVLCSLLLACMHPPLSGTSRWRQRMQMVLLAPLLIPIVTFGPVLWLAAYTSPQREGLNPFKLSEAFESAILDTSLATHSLGEHPIRCAKAREKAEGVA